MARPTIENLRQVGDFQSSFRWNMRIDTPPSAVSGFPNSDNLNLRLESTSLPKTTNQMTEVMIRGHKVKQPSIMEYDGQINFAFVETVDNVVKTFIKQWREALWATRTGVAASDRRGLQAVVTLTLLNNQDTEVWRYKLYGVMLTDYDMGQLDGSNTDAVKPNITLAYDYFEDSAV
jgi:hypothetical protein